MVAGFGFAFNDIFSYSRANCSSDPYFFYEVMDVHGGEVGSLVGEWLLFPFCIHSYSS